MLTVKQTVEQKIGAEQKYSVSQNNKRTVVCFILFCVCLFFVCLLLFTWYRTFFPLQKNLIYLYAIFGLYFVCFCFCHFYPLSYLLAYPPPSGSSAGGDKITVVCFILFPVLCVFGRYVVIVVFYPL